jgi:dienelactone hydrolase
MNLNTVNPMPKREQTASSLRKTATDPVGGVVVFSNSRGRAAGRQTNRRVGSGLDRLAVALESAGLAVHRIQLPVTGSSNDQKRTGKNGVARSVKRKAEKSFKAAVERFAAECGNGGDRIAVLAEGAAADAAVLSARAHQVRSFVLLSGRLSRKAKEILAEWVDDPVLCLVSSENKSALRDMTDVYFASEHADTDIRVFEGVGRGTEMIERWAQLFPEGEPLEHAIAGWLRRQLSSVGLESEVSFVTEDGWKIFGNLLLPDSNGKPAPGAVLLHSGRSDRYVFAHLERLLVRAGFAVLNIDWRGRGKSINKGKYFDLSKEERANGKLDAKAAIDFLTSQAGVDRERVGLVGIVHGAEHAVRGSIGDPRVKALALLTGYVPVDQRERDYLTSGKVHAMYVTCTGHKHVTETMRGLYEATSDKLTRLSVYEGGAIGYQLFELDGKLEPAIVEWLKEGVSP